MNKKYIIYVILGFLFIGITVLSWAVLADFLGDDWVYTFRPAIEKLLSGENPYLVDQFMIAPWGLLPLVPLVYLPDSLAIAVIRIVGLIVYAFVAIRLGSKPIGMVLLLLSPQVMHNLINGNIDWLCLFGFILPPQIGLFFALIKPQIGIALVAFWAIDAIKKKKFIATFAPITIAFLISLIIFGMWPLRYSNVQKAYNASAWPLSLPFGIVLLYVAVKRKQVRIAQAISPLFSPHVMFHSWATMLFALAPNTTELVIAVLSSWIIVGLTAIGFP